eukprot:8801645-Pyramimonas_sp.AAC.2
MEKDIPGVTIPEVVLPKNISKADYNEAMAAWSGDSFKFSDPGLKGAIFHPTTFVMGGSLFLGLTFPAAIFGGMVVGRLITYKRLSRSRKLLELASTRDKKFLT